MGIYIAARRKIVASDVVHGVLRPLLRSLRKIRACVTHPRYAHYWCPARGMNQPYKIDLDKLRRLRASAEVPFRRLLNACSCGRTRGAQKKIALAERKNANASRVQHAGKYECIWTWVDLNSFANIFENFTYSKCSRIIKISYQDFLIFFLWLLHVVFILML